jgi:hypothetical protein
MRNSTGLNPKRSLYPWVVSLLLATLALGGCGDSEPSQAELRERQYQAELKRENRENRQAQKELEGEDLKDCGGRVFANEIATCTFARNIQAAYYGEVVSGEGEVIGLHPRTNSDYTVHCTGTVPHKCTGDEGEGEGIERLKGAVLFFSP